MQQQQIQFVALVINLIFLIASTSASMVAIDSNAQVKSEHRHTYNFLIIILFMLVLQLISGGLTFFMVK